VSFYLWYSVCVIIIVSHAGAKGAWHGQGEACPSYLSAAATDALAAMMSLNVLP
jgi:hypothetical protein